MKGLENVFDRPFLDCEVEVRIKRVRCKLSVVGLGEYNDAYLG